MSELSNASDSMIVECRYIFPWNRVRHIISEYAWVEHDMDQQWLLLREMNDLNNVASLAFIYPYIGVIELVYMRFQGDSYFLAIEGEFVTVANFDGMISECPYYAEKRTTNSLL